MVTDPAGVLHTPPEAAISILSLRQTFSSTYTGRFHDMGFPLGGVRYAEVENNEPFPLASSRIMGLFTNTSTRIAWVWYGFPQFPNAFQVLQKAVRENIV